MGAGKKREEAKTQSNKNKKDFSQNHFFPFFLLFFFHEPSNPLLSFFFNNQMMCGCGSVSCTQCAKGEGWRVLWKGQRAGGFSLRVKRDERMGVWCLDEVDVSVMAWCQTLCHCQWKSHQLIPQWLTTVQCVSKPLCCCHFNQCVGAAVLSHFCPLSNPFLIGICHLFCCLHHELCLCWVCLCVLCDVK